MALAGSGQNDVQVVAIAHRALRRERERYEKLVGPGLDARAVEVSGVPGAVPSEQAGVAELASHRLGPRIRGGGIAGRADQEDGTPTCDVDLGRLLLGLDRPVGAPGPSPGDDGAEIRGHLDQLGAEVLVGSYGRG